MLGSESFYHCLYFCQSIFLAEYIDKKYFAQYSFILKTNQRKMV